MPHALCSGDNVVEELQYHLDKVYVSAMEAGTSNDTLRRLAKQNAKGLLRIAQTGLKNTKGGTGEYAVSSASRGYIAGGCAFSSLLCRHRMTYD